MNLAELPGEPNHRKERAERYRTEKNKTNTAA
jgi:hypothetical protein